MSPRTLFWTVLLALAWPTCIDAPRSPEAPTDTGRDWERDVTYEQPAALPPQPCESVEEGRDFTSRSVYTYDDQRRLVTEAIDYGNNGRIDTRRDFTYLKRGVWLVERETDSSIIPGSSAFAPDQVLETWRYVDGRIEVQHADYDVDGTWDWGHHYIYDDQGLLIQEIVSASGNNDQDETVWRYSCGP